MVTLERIEHAVISHPDPVVTVADVVEALDQDASDTHVRQQMRVLEAKGTLGNKETGARSLAWWHTERVKPAQTDPAEHPDQADLETINQHSDSESGERVEQEQAPSWLGDLEKPPSTLHRALWIDAAQAIVGHVRKDGHTTRSKAIDALHKEYPAGYDSNERTWWRKVARPILEAHPSIEAPASGASKWRWIEP